MCVTILDLTNIKINLVKYQYFLRVIYIFVIDVVMFYVISKLINKEITRQQEQTTKR